MLPAKANDLSTIQIFRDTFASLTCTTSLFTSVTHRRHTFINSLGRHWNEKCLNLWKACNWCRCRNEITNAMFGYVFGIFFSQRNLHLLKKLTVRTVSEISSGVFNKSFCTTFLAIPFEIFRFRKEFTKFLVAHSIRMAIARVWIIYSRAIDSSVWWNRNLSKSIRDNSSNLRTSSALCYSKQARTHTENRIRWKRFLLLTRSNRPETELIHVERMMRLWMCHVFASRECDTFDT